MTASRCIVCSGSPTVKSHLVPRALFHDLRGDDKHLVAGAVGGPRLNFAQSGVWNGSLLCTDCEARLGAADTYGVNFVRAVLALPTSGTLFEICVRNDQPKLLVKFALQCIWRCLAAETGGRPARLLGPYADTIRDVIFGDGETAPFTCFVFRTNFALSREETLRMFVGPERSRFMGANTWKICLFGVDFFTKVGGGRWPEQYESVDAGKVVNLPVLLSPRMEMSDTRFFDGIGETLAAARLPRTRR